MTWVRPESVPFPSVWRHFEGKEGDNGQKRKYWVQDIPNEYMDIVVRYMSTYFLKEEIMCVHLNAIADEKSVEEQKSMWREFLRQRMGLICFTKDDNGNKQIVGINATYICTSADKSDLQVQGESWKILIGAMDLVQKRKNCYKELNIDAYMGAMGLIVLPGYRGEGIGLQLLNARRDLCEAVGVRASLTVFTSIASQTLAKKAGFKDFSEITFEEYEKLDPPFIFPGITSSPKTRSLKFMYILY